jgi:DNA topoisomerase IA
MPVIIIAEKPNACKNIAKALAESGLEKKKSSYGVEYFVFKRNGKTHIAIPAVGHLFNLKQISKGQDYPIFDVEWQPSFKANKKAKFSEKYFKSIEEIVNNYDAEKVEFISACDYDNEGSLIAANILIRRNATNSRLGKY